MHLHARACAFAFICAHANYSGYRASCWKTGCMVSLGDAGEAACSSKLACIHSVDMGARTATCAVLQGQEMLLSRGQPKKSDIVRLAMRYASSPGAAAGPLMPSELGKIIELEDCSYGFVLVRPLQRGADKVWWYRTDALAWASEAVLQTCFDGSVCLVKVPLAKLRILAPERPENCPRLEQQDLERLTLQHVPKDDARTQKQEGQINGKPFGAVPANVCSGKKLECFEAEEERILLAISSRTLSILANGPVFASDEATITAAMAQAQSTEDHEPEPESLAGTTWTHYNVYSSFQELLKARDSSGNTVAHYCARYALAQTLDTILSTAQGKRMRFVANDSFESPEMLRHDLLQPLVPALVTHKLHTLIVKGAFFKTPRLVRMALCCKEDYETPGTFSSICDAILNVSEAGRAGVFQALQLANDSSDVRAKIYGALASLCALGPKQASVELAEYEDMLEQSSEGDDVFDPIIFLVHYRLLQKKKCSSKKLRSRAALALEALRCFPLLARRWLGEHGLDNASSVPRNAVEDASSDSEDEDPVRDTLGAPEAEWELCKENYPLKSAALDNLMKLTGLEDVKEKAVMVVKEVLVSSSRPDSIDASTSANFLFTGNPGCGKTTVAKLLAVGIHEIGFRTSPIIKETSAQQILKLKNTAKEFEAMLEKARGWTIFIDEAYLFASSTSNKVLDYLTATKCWIVCSRQSRTIQSARQPPSSSLDTAMRSRSCSLITSALPADFL